MRKNILLLPLLFLLSHPVSAQIINASTCSSTDVQTAINSASTGYTVNVPAGSCSWGNGSVNLAKAITLNGAGQGITTIDVSTGNPSFKVTQSAAGTIRITNFTFTATSGSDVFPQSIQLAGTWPPLNAIVFQNDTINMNGSSMFGATVGGGLIFSNITSVGGWNDFFIQITDNTDTNSWTTADTFGSRDTTGLDNIYIETSSFTGSSNGVTDCDSNCRLVFRHNTLANSGGVNSHGFDSSQFGGMREFEIYNNSFTFPDPTAPTGNINWYIWLRGGTGVIYNNSFQPLYSSTWGDKTEVRLSIRGAEDDRPNGISCAADTYPVMHQLGQNNNGVGASFNPATGVFSGGEFTDPIYIWNNTGTSGPDAGGYTIETFGGWAFGNPCGFNWNTYFQWGRDGENTSLSIPIILPSGGGSVEGIGGTAKPGYTAYTYPHPLISGGGGGGGASPPTNVSIIVVF